MFPAMSTAPGNTTACVFPMANGAGFPVGSAVTARWTTFAAARPKQPGYAGLPQRPWDFHGGAGLLRPDRAHL